MDVGESQHALLVLGDSTLPIGSFAFSSGLESFLAHHHTSEPVGTICQFIDFSIRNLATSSLPFIFALYSRSKSAAELDDLYETTILCTVAHRQSTTQGKSLLYLLRTSLQDLVRQPLYIEPAYEQCVRSGDAAGHYCVAWAYTCLVCGVSLEDAVYVFQLNAVKAIISAAVRLGTIGPYKGQALLAAPSLRQMFKEQMDKSRHVLVDNVAYSWPMLDIWQARQDLLYSRIFNS